MRLYRKIEEKLEEWYESKYGLIVFGSRQVGKTYIINEFLKEKFEDYYYLNLYENVNAISVLVKSVDTKDFLLRLSALSNHEIKDSTCIFIDEIQEYYNYLEKHKEIDIYYDLITSSKFIVENTNNRIVFSGSLLRLELNNIISNPVGYLLPLELYPLDFEEFLMANGVNRDLIDVVKDCFNEEKEVPDYLHNQFLDYFIKYILVGGMPNAVSEFVDSNSFVRVENAHKTIDYFIRQDITKYASDNEKLKIQEIYDLVPTELDKMSKRFIISDIPGHNKNENEQLSFSWLNRAGVTIPVYIADNPRVPLRASAVRNKLKLYHEDVGLLTYALMGYETKVSVLSGNVNINYGALYENACAQLLYAHGFNNLYYYANKKNGEVDFLLEKAGKVWPVEIKSGKDYNRHSALNNLLNNNDYGIDSAYVFYNGNVIRKNSILYLPIYMIDLLKRL